MFYFLAELINNVALWKYSPRPPKHTLDWRERPPKWTPQPRVSFCSNIPSLCLSISGVIFPNPWGVYKFMVYICICPVRVFIPPTYKICSKDVAFLIFRIFPINLFLSKSLYVFVSCFQKHRNYVKCGNSRQHAESRGNLNSSPITHPHPMTIPNLAILLL